MCIYIYIYIYIYIFVYYIYIYIYIYDVITLLGLMHMCLGCPCAIWKEAAKELGTLRAKFARNSDMQRSKLEDLQQDVPCRLQHVASAVYNILQQIEQIWLVSP